MAHNSAFPRHSTPPSHNTAIAQTELNEGTTTTTTTTKTGLGSGQGTAHAIYNVVLGSFSPLWPNRLR